MGADPRRAIKRLRDGMRRDSELGHERELKSPAGIESRIDRIQRAFDTELQSNVSLNLRGTALAIGSALAILLVAQFSAVWLDDNNWSFPGNWDTVQRVLLALSLVALVLCLVIAAWVVWPRRRWGREMMERIDYLREGSVRKEAVVLLQMLESQRALNERKGRRLRWATLPLALAVIAVVGQAGFFAWKASPIDRGGCLSDEGDAERPAATGLPDEEVQQVLALQYAPRVYVHPGEKWGPLGPDNFIEASRLVWNSPRADDELVSRGSIDSTRLGADCEKAEGGCYEHSGCAADQVTRPTESPGLRPPGLNERRGFAIDPDATVRRPSSPGNPNIPVYYEFHGNEQSLRLTYWFFYGFSQPNLGPAQIELASHEGDWESIDVKLSAEGGNAAGGTAEGETPEGGVEEATSYIPRRVIYYAHGKQPAILDWAQAPVVNDQGVEITGAPPVPAHPVVFSAVGSHASYPTEGPQAHADQTGRGRVVWNTWLRPIRRVTDEDWWGFGGAWGAGGGLKGQIGPLGPSPWKQSSDPDPDVAVLEPGTEPSADGT